MIYRKYDKNKDRDASIRIYKEVSWLEKDTEKDIIKKAIEYIEASDAYVAEIRNSAECLVTVKPGTIRYLDEELSLHVISGVTTSRIARKLNCASKLTAKAISGMGEKDVDVVTLGFFEQGFYNRLGFGQNPYEHWVQFDPSTLNVKVPFRIPHRIEMKDYKKVHKSISNRMVRHGMCKIDHAEHTHVFMQDVGNGFGLGYYDTKGNLTHCFWAGDKGENGPYEINIFTYQNHDQFLELMALIKGLGDQVFAVEMREPSGIQFQDLLNKPFRSRAVTERHKYVNNMWAISYSQSRIINLNECIEKTHLNIDGPKFNLKLTDPIEDYLDEDSKWKGITGEYVLKLGKKSIIENGCDNTLPILEASVGAFTRMWLGVQSASGLSVTDELSGSKELLLELDKVLRLPKPYPGFEY